MRVQGGNRGQTVSVAEMHRGYHCPRFRYKLEVYQEEGYLRDHGECLSSPSRQDVHCS